MTPLVVLATAAVVWARDRVTVVLAALVIAFRALWGVATHAVVLVVDLGRFLSQPASWPTGLGVAFAAVAAAVVTVAAVCLTLASRGLLA